MHIVQDGHPKTKVLSVFSLVMINVIAVDSLRSLSISAEYGFSLVCFYIIGAVMFFVPIALVAAELATGWPKVGGLYVWVREAFGQRWGLVAIWLQWIYNVVWYPAILSFIAGTLAYLIDPQLANNKGYVLAVVLISFWTATLVNCFGMKVSAFISMLGAVIGTILPMIFIMGLGGVWLLKGNPSHVDFSWASFWPDVSSINQLAYFVAVLFGLLGMEMSAVHAEDVKNPQRDYPRALLYSGIIILATLMFASLAIAIVIPQPEISLVTGFIDAYQIFFARFGLMWMTPVIAVLIILGGLSCVSAWIIGPTKGLLAAAEDGCLPHLFRFTTEEGVPIFLLIIQGLIFSVLCAVFILMPNVNSAYWILTALTAQLAMLGYLFMFAASIKLRYKCPDVKRSYRVPGGKVGIWIVGVAGMITCIFAIGVGFFPPPDMGIDGSYVYEATLITGILIFCAMPLILYRVEKGEDIITTAAKK